MKVHLMSEVIISNPTILELLRPCLTGEKKLLDCRLLRRISAQAYTMIKGKDNFIRKKLLGTNQRIKFKHFSNENPIQFESEK